MLVRPFAMACISRDLLSQSPVDIEIFPSSNYYSWQIVQKLPNPEAGGGRHAWGQRNEFALGSYGASTYSNACDADGNSLSQMLQKHVSGTNPNT